MIAIGNRIEKTRSDRALGSYLTKLDRIWPSWIEKVRSTISCIWEPGEAGNTPIWILERDPTHSETRKTMFEQFRGKSSCLRAGIFFQSTANPTAIRSGLSVSDILHSVQFPDLGFVSFFSCFLANKSRKSRKKSLRYEYPFHFTTVRRPSQPHTRRTENKCSGCVTTVHLLLEP